jgi:GWxTD domain-containing protein
VKSKGALILCLILSLCGITEASGQKKKSSKDLPSQYRKWLEQEVVYIITPKEKEVFLQLETDKEREIFITAFWKQRDPEPLTPENEFKTEHFRRIAYANQNFGREGPGAGWRSAMGRIYILLGEPAQIDRFENDSEIFPTILWFYQGLVELGLPNSFYVAFFKRTGVGEYELYSPVKDGPQSLIINYRGDPADYLAAYDRLYNINPTVAAVSMTLISEEAGQLASPSLASEILITSKIPKAPHEKVSDDYAQKLLAYKDIVEVDYTANYVPSDAEVEVIRDARGLAFVHYLIEPKKLTLTQVGESFRANLEVNCLVADLQGTTIYQYDRTVPIEFSEDQLDRIKNKLFSFQDIFPLVEGNYKINVLLKNTISKEFTSMEQALSIPGAEGPRIGRLVLANKVIRNSEYRGSNKPFLVGSDQLVPSPRNDFVSRDTLYVYFQITGLGEELRSGGSLEYSILKEGEKVLTATKLLQDYGNRTNFLEEFSLADLAPAYYRMRVVLRDQAAKEILVEQKDFVITHLPELARPWVLSIPQPSSENPVYDNILGVQYLNKKDRDKARSLLRQAHNQNPSSSKFALDYGRVLFADKEYQKVKEVASPHLQSQNRPDFLILLGQSCQGLGDMAAAIAHYKDYLAQFGANIQVLNSVGECYYQVGDMEEALVAWKKSLELAPKQEKIRKLVESVEEKK